MFNQFSPEWKEKLWGFTADGAAVNGVRRAMSAPGGTNLASLLQSAIGSTRQLMVVHCAPHRLQLAMKDAWVQDEYLKEVEEWLRSLHSHLKNSTKATGNLCFWSHVLDDPLHLVDLGLGKARWLSQLVGMVHAEEAYLPLIAHLNDLYHNPSDDNQKKWAQKSVQFAVSWKFRVVIAGCIDILKKAWVAKLRLERHLNVCKVDTVVDELSDKIDKYCKHNSTLANAFVQHNAGQPPPAQATHIEKVLAEMALKKNAIEIRTRKKRQDGQAVNSRLHLTMLESDEEIKGVFKLLGRYGDNCIAALKQRFENVAEVFVAFKLFEPEAKFEVAEETRMALVLAASCGAEPGKFVADLRDLLAAKEFVLKSHGDLRSDSQRNSVWKYVFQKLEAESDFSWDTFAVKTVVSYLILQAQSAHCEAMLSKRSHIKRALMGQGDAKLYNVYAQVQSNLDGGVHAGIAKDVMGSVVARYLGAKERRAAIPKSHIPKPGRARASLRAQRSDKGGVRKPYKKRKAQVPVLRGRLLARCSLKMRRLAAQAADEVDDIMKPV